MPMYMQTGGLAAMIEAQSVGLQTRACCGARGVHNIFIFDRETWFRRVLQNAICETAAANSTIMKRAG